MEVLYLGCKNSSHGYNKHTGTGCKFVWRLFYRIDLDQLTRTAWTLT